MVSRLGPNCIPNPTQGSTEPAHAATAHNEACSSEVPREITPHVSRIQSPIRQVEIEKPTPLPRLWTPKPELLRRIEDFPAGSPQFAGAVVDWPDDQPIWRHISGSARRELVRYIVARDQTDLREYIEEESSSTPFVCRHFSRLMYRKYTQSNATTVVGEGLYKFERAPRKLQIPIFQTHTAIRGRHAFNAVRIGQTANDPKSWYFFEPQTDGEYIPPAMIFFVEGDHAAPLDDASEKPDDVPVQVRFVSSSDGKLRNVEGDDALVDALYVGEFYPIMSKVHYGTLGHEPEDLLRQARERGVLSEEQLQPLMNWQRVKETMTRAFGDGQLSAAMDILVNPDAFWETMEGDQGATIYGSGVHTVVELMRSKAVVDDSFVERFERTAF